MTGRRTEQYPWVSSASQGQLPSRGLRHWILCSLGVCPPQTYAFKVGHHIRSTKIQIKAINDVEK